MHVKLCERRDWAQAKEAITPVTAPGINKTPDDELLSRSCELGRLGVAETTIASWVAEPCLPKRA